MGFVSHVLGNVNGIQYFYITGMFIFLALFGYILYRTLRIPKRDIIEFKQSILDNED